jgi:hypothetical protein
MPVGWSGVSEQWKRSFGFGAKAPPGFCDLVMSVARLSFISCWADVRLASSDFVLRSVKSCLGFRDTSVRIIRFTRLTGWISNTSLDSILSSQKTAE